MKQRLEYFLILILVVLLGLSTRKFPDFYPHFISCHFGDVLWAAMVYFGIRLLFPKKKLLFAVVVSLLFSFLIELSQLYQAEWINNIRVTTLGALILGHGFLFIDLLRYTAGVGLAFLADHLIINRKKQQRKM